MYVTKYAVGLTCGSGHRLMVNLLTGAVDLLNNDLFTEIMRLKEGVEHSVRPEDLAALVERGYVFPSEAAEQELFDELKQEYLAKIQQEPFSFWICPTYGCNLDCTYCFEGGSRDNFSVITPGNIAAAFAAMDRLNTVSAPPTLHVYGGEPLLNGNQAAVRAILTQATRRGYILNIISNGTGIPGFVDILSEYREGINYVQTTLDGIAEIHDQGRIDRSKRGTFNKIVAGIDTLVAAQVPVQIRSNLGRGGVERYGEFIDFARSKGWLDCPTLKCYFTMVNNRHCAETIDCLNEVEVAQAMIAIRQIAESDLVGDFDTTHVLDNLMVNLGYVTNRGIGPKFHFCNSGWGKLFLFGPDGLVYPCPSAAGDRSMSIGTYAPELDIREDLFDRWRFESVDKLERCQGCVSMLTCGGGCPFKALKLGKGQQLCDDPLATMQEFVNMAAPDVLAEEGEGGNESS